MDNQTLMIVLVVVFLLMGCKCSCSKLKEKFSCNTFCSATCAPPCCNMNNGGPCSTCKPSDCAGSAAQPVYQQPAQPVYQQQQASQPSYQTDWYKDTSNQSATACMAAGGSYESCRR